MSQKLTARRYSVVSSLAMVAIGTIFLSALPLAAQRNIGFEQKRPVYAPLLLAPTADRDLDATFGPAFRAYATGAGGRARVFSGFANKHTEAVNSIALQHLGANNRKIIIAGQIQSNPTFLIDEWVGRLNVNGSVDTSFGGTGLIATDYPGSQGNRGIDVAVVPGTDQVVVVGFAGL